MQELGGQAKAMVITASRQGAVKYRQAFEEYITKKGYDGIHALVAFSGKVKLPDDDKEYTEASINGFPEDRLTKEFDTDNYQVLLVANKYQTGFDQPKLCAMYVLKKLRGVNAVQTLSRLNRICAPYDKKTFVLDFVNTYEDIKAAFAPYYTTTLLANSVTPNAIYDLEATIDAYALFDPADIEAARMDPDGSFKIEALKRNLFTMTEYDKYMDYFGLNEENKNDYRGVIGLVKDAEGNINLIKDTNMYSMPDYTAMGDVLKNVASEGRFPGKDVVTWLRLVMDTTDKIKVHAELDIVIPHIDVNAEYTKANVMGLFKGITTKKEVVRYVFENTGIMLYAYLRGEEERREYLSGNIDINYFDYDDTHAKYSVGEIGNGMKYTIERASVVREIQAVEGSKLIFKKVLPLMGVEFVRYGMLTVVPFPFKYLREYIVKEEKSV